MFGEFINYLQYQKRYSLHTVTSYQNDLEDFCSFIESEHNSCSISEINEQIIRGFIVSLIKSGLSNRTVNRKISSLRSFYKYRLQQKKDLHSPMQNVKSLKVPKEVQTPFSEEEINSLLDNNEMFPETFEGKRDHLMVMLLYTLGIRKSELLGLKWVDVDFGQKIIKVFGKRNKERLIPLLDEVALELDDFKKITSQYFTSISSKIFIDKNANELSQSIVYKLVNMYLSKVSTKHKKSPHILRHTFASHLLNSGAEISAIKELLGHESLASTQVYTHTNIKELKKVFNQSHPRGSE